LSVSAGYQRKPQAKREQTACVQKKLHRDVTTERVKAKKAMNIGERNKYMDVQTSRSLKSTAIKFFSFSCTKNLQFHEKFVLCPCAGI
jgi:hypothetical protein